MSQLFYYIDYIQSYISNNKPNLNFNNEFAVKYYMEQGKQILNFDKIKGSIFNDKYNIYKDKKDKGICILPLVYNLLNSVGNILFECSR